MYKATQTMHTVLITGASGLVGCRLKLLLQAEGYTVHTLGRSKSKAPGNFTWNPAKGKLDPKALAGVTTIIHLAGAGIADKRWTTERKKEILDSRIQTAQLLYKHLQNNLHTVTTIISAGAVGYYGDCGDEVVDESHAPGSGFLSDVCRQWEDSIKQFETLGIRTVICRIGVVLAREGGALPELERTLPIGIAGYFAKPNLYYPWVHLTDVCGIMQYALENKNLQGIYNTTAPQPILIKELMQHIVKARHSRAILTPVPPLALKLALGEMSDMVLHSQRCSAAKIVKAGYRFKYGDIDEALTAIYKK